MSGFDAYVTAGVGHEHNVADQGKPVGGVHVLRTFKLCDFQAAAQVARKPQTFSNPQGSHSGQALPVNSLQEPSGQGLTFPSRLRLAASQPWVESRRQAASRAHRGCRRRIMGRGADLSKYRGWLLLHNAGFR